MPWADYGKCTPPMPSMWNALPSTPLHPRAGRAMDHRKLNDADLFTAFFSQATGDEISPNQAAAYAAVVDAMRQQERETG